VVKKEVLEQHRKHTLLVKEFSMQTSFENLPLLKAGNQAFHPEKLDKSMQTSLQSLYQKDFGTQTRKSATKKQKKRRLVEGEPQEVDQGEKEEKEADCGMGGAHDPVLQLLTPG